MVRASISPISAVSSWPLVTLAYPLHPPACIPAALPQDPRKVEYPGNKDLTKPLVSTQVPAVGEAARPTYGQRCLNPLHVGGPSRELPAASGLSWAAQVPQGPEADGFSDSNYPPAQSLRQALTATVMVCLPYPGEGAGEGRRAASKPTHPWAGGCSGTHPKECACVWEKGPSSGVGAVLVLTLLIPKKVVLWVSV